VGRIDGRSGTKNIASGRRKCHEMQKKYGGELIEVNFDRKDPILYCPLNVYFREKRRFQNTGRKMIMSKLILFFPDRNYAKETFSSYCVETLPNLKSENPDREFTQLAIPGLKMSR
jgi:hypothetical protein